MAEYRCTWWEDTGRNAPFEDGVSKRIYRNRDTGAETSQLPIGALFVDDRGPKGPDGLSVVCIIPREGNRGYTWWHIDSQASNCTLPDDKEHRCWVRHGTIGETVHVDKNGKTCAAGAGSIAVPGFHGFLHHGVLRDC
ncbi:hypothetical protein CK222_21780 [Mesorhizobium sp. WSM3866]|uniref:hypothetical protein n=1 Tax=Mesorhizobium sp. WSM3866 TaxID=422271 RepID=UPI000BAF8DFE|nr:hypothetical protein [Mesorhizobium sp. WSM3866]PBB41787.1 hypothetical protein CK222_21780 [Mesorhizobium sp. WSM3866]TIU88816.1 MAG: hypothetical protein E5W06_00160 [Mesorhizobium sp.]